MRYDTLLFDADGTLLDFSRSEHEALVAALSAFGLPTDEHVVNTYSAINDDLWKQLERGTIKKTKLRLQRFALLAEKLGISCDTAALADRYEDELATRAYILGNALEVCTVLAQQHRLYLVTNGFVKIQRGRFLTTPLRPLFKDVFISDEIGFDKPSLRYFEAVMARIPAFNASRTLIIGDSLTSDIRGGINAGIDTCWFNPEHKSAPDGMRINYIIDDLKQLYSITN